MPSASVSSSALPLTAHPLAGGDQSPAGAAVALQCLQVVGGHTAQAASFEVSGLAIQARCQPLITDDVAASGGDLFFVSACAQHKIGRVFLADIAGHGEPVAATASVLHRWMQRYVNHTSQTAFVSKLNRVFARGPLTPLAGAATGHVSRHATPFATALALSYYEPTQCISYVSCGHPPALLYSAKRGSWRVLTEDVAPKAGEVINLPLGVLAETAYQAIELRAEPGDAMLLYTDALIEQPDPDSQALPAAGGGGVRQLGVEGLVRHLNRAWQAARDQGLDPRFDASAGQWLLSTLIHPQGLQHTLQDDATALLISVMQAKPAGPTVLQRLRAFAAVAWDTIIWPVTGKAPALPPLREPAHVRTEIRF